MEIQGNGQFSPFDGVVVDTTGVVTLFTTNGNNCWVQDPDGDGDDATSDGIFVSGCAFADIGPVPNVGEFIRIIAEVEEQQFGTNLPLTRLRSVDLIEVQSSGNLLPDAVELEDLPNESVVGGIDFWEPLEGMRVSVRNAPVVAATSRFGEFAILSKDDAKPSSGFFPQAQQVLIRSLGNNEVDYNPERILVDDATLPESIVVMPKDRMRHLVGVVDYTFGNYKIQPDAFEVKTHRLPAIPVSHRDGDVGDTVITTFNVENLFDLVQDTATVVDVIGQVGVDPGSEWGSLDNSTRDNTIRRMESICQGDTNLSDSFDPGGEWNGFPTDTFDGMGVHAVTCGATTDVLVSEYVEGSSFNKALEIYNGTGSDVNLGQNGYAIDIFFNGSSSAGRTVLLSGTVADGDVFVVAHPSADAAITCRGRPHLVEHSVQRRRCRRSP